MSDRLSQRLVLHGFGAKLRLRPVPLQQFLEPLTFELARLGPDHRYLSPKTAKRLGAGQHGAILVQVTPLKAPSSAHKGKLAKVASQGLDG